jgi:hypothetical protein
MTKIHNPVEESSSYDNFLNKKEVYEEKAVLPIEVEREDEISREKMWSGMPEFVQDEKKTYKTIYLHFRNEEDFLEFVKKYAEVDKDQLITKKTKSMWYPHLDRDENSLKRWFEQ